jgi:hypothetical protein
MRALFTVVEASGARSDLAATSHPRFRRACYHTYRRFVHLVAYLLVFRLLDARVHPDLPVSALRWFQYLTCPRLGLWCGSWLLVSVVPDLLGLTRAF